MVTEVFMVEIWSQLTYEYKSAIYKRIYNEDFEIMIFDELGISQILFFQHPKNIRFEAHGLKVIVFTFSFHQFIVKANQ